MPASETFLVIRRGRRGLGDQVFRFNRAASLWLFEQKHSVRMFAINVVTNRYPFKNILNPRSNNLILTFPTPLSAFLLLVLGQRGPVYNYIHGELISVRACCFSADRNKYRPSFSNNLSPVTQKEATIS